MQKTCKVCNEKKDLSLFRADSHLPDGRRNHCKLCRNRKLKSKNGGNVFLRTHISEVESFEQKFIPEPNSGCWLWEMPDKNGKYGSFTFNKIRRSAHRASWEIYIGKILGGLFVCHKCDVTFCVNPNHLFLGTHQDNMNDKVKKGRQNNGNGK